MNPWIAFLCGMGFGACVGALAVAMAVVASRADQMREAAARLHDRVVGNIGLDERTEYGLRLTDARQAFEREHVDDDADLTIPRRTWADARD